VAVVKVVPPEEKVTVPVGTETLFTSGIAKVNWSEDPALMVLDAAVTVSPVPDCWFTVWVTVEAGGAW
jgi:hypothetical protein